MNLLKTLLVLIFILPGAEAFAAGRLGAGIIIGSPTGLSGKYHLSRRNSIDAAFAWDLGHTESFHLHSDYLWTKKNAIEIDYEHLDFFYGVGARLKTKNDKHDDDDTSLGLRVPAGLSYNFRDPSIEVFGEVAAIMDLVPSTGLDIDLGIGLRYFF